jgi:LysR family transcriptional regulator, hydrogen peroxide-inducible genes activator
MNLSQLQYVKAVADTLSFSRASEECFVTQPTLSNAIVQLEEELGGRLFNRTTRKVSLTDFGIFMMPLIENLLLAQTTLVNQSKAFQNIEETQLRLGLSPLINTSLLTKVIEPFANNHPNLSFIYTELNLTDLHYQLTAQKLDFAFAPTSSDYPNHNKFSFYEEELLYIVKKKSKKSANGRLSLEDIAGEIFLMVPNECGLANTTRELFKQKNIHLKEYSGKALSYQMLENWANLGIGSTILPKSKVLSEDNSTQMIFDESGKPLMIGYEMVWDKKTIQNTNLKEFIKHFKTIVPSIVKGTHEMSK